MCTQYIPANKHAASALLRVFPYYQITVNLVLLQAKPTRTSKRPVTGPLWGEPNSYRWTYEPIWLIIIKSIRSSYKFQISLKSTSINTL